MRRRPRVLLFSDSPLIAGGERYLLELARGLPPDVFGLSAVTSDEPAVDPFADELRSLGVRVKRLPSIATLRDKKAFMRVLAYFARNRPSIVHFNLVDPRACNGAITAAVATLQRGFVVTEHLPTSPFDDRPLPLRHRVATRVTEVTIVNSQDLKRVIEARPHFHGRVKVVPNGIPDPGAPDDDRRRAARATMGIADHRGPVVGMVARLHPQKNPLLFVEGAARVLASRNDALFVVVGEGERREAMEARAHRLGIDASVRFLGYRPDAPDLMYGLDALVNTSTYEGQPFSILEAMLRGVAVVAPRIAGMEDLVADRAGGRLVELGNDGQLGEVLLDVMQDADRLRRMGRVARERAVTLFSAETMCRRTADVYTELLS